MKIHFAKLGVYPNGTTYYSKPTGWKFYIIALDQLKHAEQWLRK